MVAKMEGKRGILSLSLSYSVSYLFPRKIKRGKSEEVSDRDNHVSLCRKLV